MKAMPGACANIAVNVDVNVMASDARADTNVAVTANANKTASNTKKHVSMY